MKTIHWYVGILLLLTGLLAHALLPRYDWQVTGDPTGIQQLVRLDKWTGEPTVITPSSESTRPPFIAEDGR